MDWAESKVHVTVTRALIKTSPEYDPARPIESLAMVKEISGMRMTWAPPAIPASRAISIVISIERLSSSSGMYDSSDVASSDRTSLTVRIVAAAAFDPAAWARAAR